MFPGRLGAVLVGARQTQGSEAPGGPGHGRAAEGPPESSRQAQPGHSSVSREEGSYGFPPWCPGKDGTGCRGAVYVGRTGEAGRALPCLWAESGPARTPLPIGWRESQTCSWRVGRLCSWSHTTWAPFLFGDFLPGGSDSKESACSAGDLGSIPGLGRSPGGGHGNPLQYSCLENPMDRGAWRATVHRVAKSRTRLSSKSQFSSVPFLQ